MFNNKKIHMIGIGGISMSGIAEILLSFNSTVTGYDAQESDITKSLISKGINVTYECNIQNVENADIIVYTAAIKEDNEELAHARKLNKEVYERSTFLGLMMKEYQNVICISGTHGKSTTSGMISTIFMHTNFNPTIQIGAMLPIINGNNHVGNKDYFIAESCEYVNSFLEFFPTCEIILNIDEDHLDFFKNLDNIIASFKKYTTLLPKDGYLIVNNDDKNTLIATKDIQDKITYGIENESMYMAKNISFDEVGHGIYDLYINNEKIKTVHLGVSGIHNVYNSLAAIAASKTYIEDLDLIINALETYKGVGRRFEYLGKYNSALIYDDYAHHPSEIKTTYESVKNTPCKRNIAVFQSHTYSRTKDHLEEFAEVLSNFDEVIILPIYAAREKNIFNVKEEDLVNLIKENGNQNVMYLASYENAVNYLKKHAEANDLIITIGAGPVNKVAIELVKAS